MKLAMKNEMIMPEYSAGAADRIMN